MTNWNQKIYEKTFLKFGVLLTPFVKMLKNRDILENDIYVGNCCQNKFIIVDCRFIDFDSKIKSDFAIKNIQKFNADSALFVKKSQKCNAFMEIFEKDGTQSDSCGNGLLLISRILGIKSGEIETRGGVVEVNGEENEQSIIMHHDSFDFKKIDNKNIFVRAGEPHLIFILNKGIESFDLNGLGELNQKKFTDGVNVDVIQKKTDGQYLIRTYERGVLCETKSCGTGSLSSYLAVYYLQGKKNSIGEIEFESSGGIHNVLYDGVKIRLKVKSKFIIFNKLKQKIK